MFLANLVHSVLPDFDLQIANSWATFKSPALLNFEFSILAFLELLLKYDGMTGEEIQWLFTILSFEDAY